MVLTESMPMNGHFKDIKKQLESMPFEEARRKIKFGELHAIGSPAHDFALSWLEGVEAELRDSREAKMLRLTRRTVIIATAAIIIAIIAAREDIRWLISLVISLFSKT